MQNYSPIIAFIDSCAFDPKNQPEQEKASIEIYKLHDKDKILLQIAHSVKKEIEHPNTPNWVKSKAYHLTYTNDASLTTQEREKLKKIEEILAGNGKVENIHEDARHIFEADKYCAYFITTDKKILKRKNVLPISIKILYPSEFLNIANNHIQIIAQEKTVNMPTKLAPRKKIESNLNYKYKGFSIKVASKQLANGGFNTDIYIGYEDDAGYIEKSFYDEKILKTKDEAIQYCINFAKKIIDGKIENNTVIDLKNRTNSLN